MYLSGIIDANNKIHSSSLKEKAICSRLLDYLQNFTRPRKARFECYSGRDTTNQEKFSEYPSYASVEISPPSLNTYDTRNQTWEPISGLPQKNKTLQPPVCKKILFLWIPSCCIPPSLTPWHLNFWQSLGHIPSCKRA